MNCKHRRIKKNYPFGRKSSSTMKCKDCGEVIMPHDLMNRKQKRKQEIKWKKIFAFIFILLFFVSFVSALTEEERIKNNRFIESRNAINNIEEKGSLFSNPFIILGFVVGIIILLFFIIKIAKERERV